MKKNSIGQNFFNANPEFKGKGHFTFNKKGQATGWIFDEPQKEGEAILMAMVFSPAVSLRKKDRKNIRLNRKYQKFLKKYCNKCFSKKDDFCGDLELNISDICFSKFYCPKGKCSWFVAKDKV